MDRDLQDRLWRFVKDRRDALDRARLDYEDAHRLLADMEAAGMANHLPTIAEVREAFNPPNPAKE